MNRSDSTRSNFLFAEPAPFIFCSLSSLGASHLIGLLFVVQLPYGLGPLLATGQSRDTSHLFSRYLSTLMHVTAW